MLCQFNYGCLARVAPGGEEEDGGRRKKRLGNADAVSHSWTANSPEAKADHSADVRGQMDVFLLADIWCVRGAPIGDYSFHHQAHHCVAQLRASVDAPV